MSENIRAKFILYAHEASFLQFISTVYEPPNGSEINEY